MFMGPRYSMIDPTGLLSIAVGLLSIIFYKKLSIWAVKSQNATWGFHFGEKERKGFQITFFIVGIIFVVLGLLSLLGITHEKP